MKGQQRVRTEKGNLQSPPRAHRFQHPSSRQGGRKGSVTSVSPMALLPQSWCQTTPRANMALEIHERSRTWCTCRCSKRGTPQGETAAEDCHLSCVRTMTAIISTKLKKKQKTTRTSQPERHCWCKQSHGTTSKVVKSEKQESLKVFLWFEKHGCSQNYLFETITRSIGAEGGGDDQGALSYRGPPWPALPGPESPLFELLISSWGRSALLPTGRGGESGLWV